MQTLVDPEIASDPRGRVVAITPRTIWHIAAAGIGLALFFIILIKTIDILLLFFAAIVIAEGIRPIVRMFSRINVPRGLSVLSVYILFVAIVGTLGWLLATPLVNQAIALTNNIPTYATQVQALLNQAQQAIANNPDISNLVTNVENQAGNSLGQLVLFLVQVPIGFAQILFYTLVTLTMAFFWLTTVDGLKPFLMSLFPQEAQSQVEDVLSELSMKLGGYLRGLLANMSIIGVLSGLGMWALGVPYALLLGVFAGMTEAIPFLGPYFGATAAVLVALASIGWLKALEVLAVYVIIQELEGNILVPVVMRQAVDLNPLAIIVSVLIGGSLFGLAGSILGVPVGVVVWVLFVRVLAPALRQQFHRTSSTVDQPYRA